MALITCPKCGKEFSDRAVACPQCGLSVNEANMQIQKQAEEAKHTDREVAGLVCLFIIFVILAVFIWLLI